MPKNINPAEIKQEIPQEFYPGIKPDTYYLLDMDFGVWIETAKGKLLKF